jgi:hypothetical protein
MKITAKVSARRISKGFYEIDVMPNDSETGISFYLTNTEGGKTPWRLQLIGGLLNLYFSNMDNAMEMCENLSRSMNPELFQD